MEYYPIIQIDPTAQRSPECMGSKPKQWVLIDGEHWLFKESRLTAGEDWSEKVAAEIGKLLGFPVADVELAEMNGKRGSISRNFVDRDKGEALWHGNEILGGNIKDYDKEKRFGHGEHNLKNIRLALGRAFQAAPRQVVEHMWQDLASYFVLDALITNTDRHHENWGFLWFVEASGDGLVTLKLRIAPSFDHASSLGRELRDEKRQLRLESRSVDQYVCKAHGAVYVTGKEAKGPSPLELVDAAAKRYPTVFKRGIGRVHKLRMDDVMDVLQKVPDERISLAARNFAFEMITYTQKQLSQIAITLGYPS